MGSTEHVSYWLFRYCHFSSSSPPSKGDDITVKHCSHALAVFYVAAEEAASKATKGNEKGLVSPGTLRMNLIDALYYLDEPHIRLKAQIFAHSTGTKPS